MQRLRNIRRALVSFCWVVFAFAVYSVCIAPFIERNREDEEPTAVVSPSEERSSDRFVRELAPLFPEGSWELDRPNVLRSQQATILLKELNQRAEDSLLVRPCTLVFYGPHRNTKNASQRGPVILQAPEGAILDFDKPIDLNRGVVGKPVGGRLVGSVRIFSAGGQDADDLELTTSNVILTDRRIWTREAVTFRLGNNYGVGQDLMIERAESTPGNQQESDWLAGLGIIQLHRLQRLTLQLAGDMFGSIGSAGQPGPSGATASADPPTMELTCDGPLRFDLNRMKVTVEQNVRITRKQIGQPTDRLRANQLTMRLARIGRRGEQPDGGPQNNTNQAESKQKLEVASIVAVGQPLIVDAPSRQAYVESRRLEYDFETKKVRLRGFNPFASRPPSAETTGQQTGRVEIRTPQHSIVAPAIDFLGTTDRTTWRMVAEGPGQYVGALADDKSKRVSASWDTRLSIAPEAGEQVLRIVGNSEVRMPELGAIQSDLIELWVQHQTAVVAQRIDGTQVKEIKSVPTKLITSSQSGGMTLIDSPRVRGHLKKMTIHFARGADAVAPTGTATPAPAGGLVGQARPNRPASRFRVEGGEMTAWVDTDQQQLQRVLVQGKSRFVEEQNASQWPFELTGNLIDYRTDQHGKQIALVQGKPAVVQSSKWRLQGETIQIRGNENYLGIPGAGSLRVQVPRNLAAAGKPTAPRNAAAEAGMDLELQWRGSLQFNGQVATVKGQTSATSSDINVRTDELRVTLDERIDFSNLGGSKLTPQIRYLTAIGGVAAAIRSRDEAGKPSAYQQIVTQDLDLDYQTGETNANGPGWLAVTMLSDGSPSPGFGDREPRQRRNSSQLMQLSVAFTRLLSGNLHRRECRLADDVRTWYGPVQNWEDRVDPVQLDELGENALRMNCRELVVLESPTAYATTGRKPLELVARGETYVESQRYAAKGHQIKFAEEKGMLTLEGDSRRAAELWQRNLLSGSSSHSGRARRIRYWPKTGQLQVDGGLGIDLSQVPVDTK